MSKITLKDCNDLAKKRNGECLSKEYKNNTTYMDWVCENGHHFSTIFKSVRKGHWCPKCAGNIKHTQEYIEDEINKRNGKLLSEYKSVDEHITIKCNKDDYIWRTTWSNIKAGSWCPKCANQPRITKKDIIDLVKNKNGQVVSLNNFSKAKDKIKVKCLVDGHVWLTTWDYLKQGNWCPKCAGKILKTYNELTAFIKSKGGHLINPSKTFNHKTKFNIKCMKDGHEWKTSYYALVYRQTWCPKCAGKILKTYDEVKDLVESRHGTLLSGPKDLKNNVSKLTVRCDKNHTWDISYKNLINNNRWCPYCKISADQWKLMEIISHVLKEKCICNFKGFSWLKDKSRLEIDIWIPSKKIAIEYDGIHHFKPIPYYNDIAKANKRYKDRVKKDKLKEKLISNHKNDVKHFIRFCYKEKISRDTVVKKLKRFGII